MTLRLYSLEPPHGRCLLLAKKLHEASRLKGSECLQIAQRLFDCQHPSGNPVIVEISQASMVSELEALCADLGIVVESVPEAAAHATNAHIQ